MPGNKPETALSLLRDETLRILSKIQAAADESATADMETALADLWKSIPARHSTPAEIDVHVGSKQYTNSASTLEHLILYYLLENACPDIVNCLILETGSPGLARIRDCHGELGRIVGETEGDNLEPLETFVRTCCAGGELELHLVCHRFLLQIHRGRYDDALRTCLRDLKTFMPASIEKIRPILRFLVNPTDVLDALQRSREELVQAFKLVFWETNDMPSKCYLRELFETGSSAFLQLSAAGSLFFDEDDNTLPIEVKIPRGLNYHSLFVCPVLKTLCVDTGPVMLECGHVISSTAASVLSKESTHSAFKCPYCPEMSKYNRILELKF